MVIHLQLFFISYYLNNDAIVLIFWKLKYPLTGRINGYYKENVKENLGVSVNIPPFQGGYNWSYFKKKNF